MQSPFFLMFSHLWSCKWHVIDKLSCVILSSTHGLMYGCSSKLLFYGPQVGRALQPSVFFIDECEKMFKKKLPKTDLVCGFKSFSSLTGIVNNYINSSSCQFPGITLVKGESCHSWKTLIYSVSLIYLYLLLWEFNQLHI